MDKIELLKELENMGEIEPDKYDGSYELMREIIKSYSGLDNYDKCTYLDINAIYMMSVGTWKFNIQKKKEYIGKGCLPKSEKERLYEILDKVWDNACNKVYENVLDRPSVGMFGAGIFSFVKKITEQCAKDFILMCVDIYKMEDDNEIYDRAESRKRKFRNIPIRMIVLSDQTTEDVRNDIFERINKGSDLLMDMEKRKGIYRGKFCDFIYNECAKNEEFIRITPLSDQLQNRQEREELILRFFALEEDYPAFSNLKGIANYLDTYLANMNEKVVNDSSLLEKKFNRFKKMVSFVSQNFEFGFAKNKGMHQVSRVYFEAVSIGSIKALDENPMLETQNINTNIWLSTGELINIVSGKYRTHNKEKIKERIDYVKNKLLSAE